MKKLLHYAAMFSSPAPTSVQYFVRGSIGDLVSPAVSARKPPPAHYCWRVITPLLSKCTALRSYLTIFESSTKNKVFQEARKGRFILDSEQHLSFPSVFIINKKSNLCNGAKSRKLIRRVCLIFTPLWDNSCILDSIKRGRDSLCISICTIHLNKISTLCM